LPAQQALSGHRSRELVPGGGNSAAGRSNHVVLDDSPGQIQVQLHSDHLHSGTYLGHITRIEGNTGRTEHRGEGFETRTDGHVAVRAQAGLLMTSHGRPQARGHVMDVAEPGLQLLQSQNQHASLGALAQQYQAQDAKDQAVVAQAMLAQTQEIRGTAGGASAATSGADPSSPKPFPEFSAPHLLLASAAGVASTTAGSTSHHSGAHHAITTGEHTSITSGKSWLTVAQNAIRMFSYKGDVRLISAKEDIDIAAIQDTVAMFAKLDVTLRGNRVIFNATKSVTISGGGSYTRWSKAGIISGTLGKWTVHAAKRDQFGPKSLPVPTVSFKGCKTAGEDASGDGTSTKN
jgi:type VI secretion system secreted protein VgrG